MNLQKYFQKIYLPKEYDPLSHDNDIALLELETKIKFDASMCKDVKPAKLYKPRLNDLESKEMILTFFSLRKAEGEIESLNYSLKIPLY